ncbi:MAG TPA: hypothetical protein VN840_07705 [Streptosporangiaceae bacterium]|nr:hypothetical protein [Streptosporangiaceae bacterium]
MRAVSTAGERVAVDCAVPKLAALLDSATAGELSEGPAADATIRLEVQADRRPFDVDGWTLIGRDAWADPPRALIVDACSSGFDLLVEPTDEVLHVTARYRPAPPTRAANVLLATRFRLLAGQTLMHYPALWWASQRGRVPLHVSVTAGAGGVTMIAGPGGVGKSTLLSAGLRCGEIATADNLCACDSRAAYGLVEPLRVQADHHEPAADDPAAGSRAAGSRAADSGLAAGGPAAPHGRREVRLTGRVPSLEPDRLVVLRRGTANAGTVVRSIPPAEAARELVAGTYMAGELRRFWSFAATLALATGVGSAQPDVSGVAALLAARLPCLEVRVAHGSPAPIGELLRLAGVR